MNMDSSSDTSTVLNQEKKRQQLAMLGAAAWTPFQQPTAIYEETRAAALYEQVYASLKELSQLPENWDGYGALQVGDQALRNAKTFVNSIALYSSGFDAPGVAPNPNGTLSLEWERDGQEAYLEIGNTRASGYCRFPRLPTTYIQGSAEDVSVWLPAFLAHISESSKPKATTITNLQYRSALHDTDNDSK
jgi:hypothetical protein